MKRTISKDTETCCGKCKHFVFKCKSADLSIDYGYCRVLIAGRVGDRIDDYKEESCRADEICKNKFEPIEQ